jgi:hypothetical protein
MGDTPAMGDTPTMSEAAPAQKRETLTERVEHLLHHDK